MYKEPAITKLPEISHRLEVGDIHMDLSGLFSLITFSKPVTTLQRSVKNFVVNSC